ncbi:MAG: hypothetical protein ACMUIP_06265 [bacterium]
MRITWKHDGFELFVTIHTETENGLFSVSAKQAFTYYREKLLIEAAFREIKSFISAATAQMISHLSRIALTCINS